MTAPFRALQPAALTALLLAVVAPGAAMLTKAGRKQLALQKQSWERLAGAVRLIFEGGEQRRVPAILEGRR
jgi:hypothetical protein